MKAKRLIITTFCILTALQTHAQPSYLRAVEKANRQISDAYMHRDVNGLLQVFADKGVLMPEYHTTLYGKKAIGAYLKLWLDSATVISSSRKTYDITKAGNYLVETGTFNSRFSIKQRVVNYDAKYLNIWQIEPGGGVRLLSQITGSCKPIDRADLPLSALLVPDSTLRPKQKPDITTRAIQTLNNEVSTLIVKSKGSEFARYYTNDAIYMPYYRAMVIGKPAIDAYYIEHEDPKTGIDAVNIGTTRVIAAANYILVDAYYKVDWRAGNSHGTVYGKNISVWKRDQSGLLLICRQMAVHD